jgi:Fe-S-cluster containining protein
MYSIDTYTEKEFEFMIRLFPKYRRFQIIGKDENDNLIFGCKLLNGEGLCSDYKNRLKMCKDYPSRRLNAGGELYKDCGYKIVFDKSFQDYLQ